MMKSIINKLFSAAIKTRIMVIFSLIALILVGSMAFISYQFVRNIYLEQIEDQIIMMNNVLANDLNQTYLDYIQSDAENMASLYYQKKLSEANTIMDLNNVFLFNRNFEILVKARDEISPARLRINQNEIEELKISGNVVQSHSKLMTATGMYGDFID